MNVLIITKDFHRGEDVSEHCKSLASFLEKEGAGAEILCFNRGEDIEVQEGIKVHEVSFMLEGKDRFE